MRPLIFILILLLFNSCGVFKKSKSTNTEAGKYLSWHFEKDDKTKQDCTRTVTRDRVQYDFTFDPVDIELLDFRYTPLPDNRVPIVAGARLEGLGSTFDILDHQLAMLLSRAKTLSIKIDREQDIQANVKESSSSDKQGIVQEEISNTATHLDKGRDTSLGVNFPWWIWVIVAGVVILLVILKRS